MGNHADCDLGSAAVEGGTQKFFAFVLYCDPRAGSNTVRLDDVRAIDPYVPFPEPIGSAAGDFHHWKSVEVHRFFRHEGILTRQGLRGDSRPRLSGGAKLRSLG